MNDKTKTLFFEKALLAQGWAENVSIEVSVEGSIRKIETGTVAGENSEFYSGVAIPGLPNIHSHAFQRAMAGLSEHKVSQKDTFWTWRNTMYGLANKMTPEGLADIASQLYMEMLKAGFTSVAEFHYVHHQQGGHEYSPICTLSDSILQASKKTGISITHLPVLYMASGFSGTPLQEQQERFGCDVDQYLRLLESVQKRCEGNYGMSAGMAFHSLRAVVPNAMSDVLSGYKEMFPDGPVHIHIAEQILEVEQCLEWSGKRPVEWLLENTDIDESWCLIHATHLLEDECRELAKTGAVAGICPTTEANLGDGFFPLAKYIEYGGSFAVGSDSNSSVSAIEEIRWLEYVQRLIHKGRNISTDAGNLSTGSFLYNACLDGGAKALGKKTGKIEVGYQADILVLDSDAALLAHTPQDLLIDTLIFAGNTSIIKDVFVLGDCVVSDYVHRDEENISRRFIETISQYRK